MRGGKEHVAVVRGVVNATDDFRESSVIAKASEQGKTLDSLVNVLHRH